MTYPSIKDLEERVGFELGGWGLATARDVVEPVETLAVEQEEHRVAPAATERAIGPACAYGSDDTGASPGTRP